MCCRIEHATLLVIIGSSVFPDYSPVLSLSLPTFTGNNPWMG